MWRHCLTFSPSPSLSNVFSDLFERLIAPRQPHHDQHDCSHETQKWDFFQISEVKFFCSNLFREIELEQESESSFENVKAL